MLRARIRYHTENANEWPKLSGVDEEEYATKVKTGNFLEVGVFFWGISMAAFYVPFLTLELKRESERETWKH